MKKLLFITLLTILVIKLNSQLVITEIMYNPPEAGTDLTEFIEIYNNSQQAINMNGYEIKDAFVIVFGDTIIAPGTYLVTTVNKAAFAGYYGFEAIQWTSGALNNSGETITLLDPAGNVVDVVSYSDRGNWPVEADGLGHSLELCNPNLDNNDPANWRISNHVTGLIIDNKELFASPGLANSVSCDEEMVHIIDVETLAFNPKNLEIKVGETVRWLNNSGGDHNVNGTQETYPENPEGFSSGNTSTDNWVFEFTFNIPGTYNYRSDLYYFLGMTGTIEVVQEKLLAITEIMYNDPATTDSLEFIEIYNLSDSVISIEGYQLEFVKAGHLFNLPALYLNPKSYLTFCADTAIFRHHFGFMPPSWNMTGLLSNDGDQVILRDATGNIAATVTYDVSLPWPTEASGEGYSISLCKPKSDPNNPANWQATPYPNKTFMEGKEIHATPGRPAYCALPVAEIRMINEDGTLQDEGLGFKVEGTVYGVNMRSEGLQFTLIDDQNRGVAIFSETKNFGYEVEEGNVIQILGILSQYNGLAQIYTDTLFDMGITQALFEPTVTTVLNETTESQLVKINNVYLQNPENWVAAGTGFTVRATDGTNVFSVRIDDHVELFNMLPPAGTFSLTGIGGQFDSTVPYLDGYQLMPRYVADIYPYVTEFEIPHYPIGLLRGIDEQGVADSLGVRCRIQGVVYGPNFRPNGLGFTVIDEFNDGMYVFLNSGNLGYEVVEEGDFLEITGTIAQFNGLTQIVPEKIELLSQENSLFYPTEVTMLNENTESQLVIIKNVTLVNPSEWKEDGSTFNVNVTNGTSTFVLRIHPSSGLSSIVAPEGTFNATGIGSQFDNSSPYFDGYQLFPRHPYDVGIINGVDQLKPIDLIVVPNPAKNHFSIISGEGRLDKVMLFDQSGRKVAEYSDVETGVFLPIGHLPGGIYFIRVIDGASVGFTRLAVVKSN